MKKPNFFHILFISLTILSLAGCNMPFFAPEPTPTATASPTPPPTETPLPTDTPVPPTETPTLPPPTDTPPPPTPIPPTATNTKVPTVASFSPHPRDLFNGTFENGTLSFRIGPNPYLVIPKMVVVKKAVCKEGGTINDALTFDDVPTYEIKDGKFTINYMDVVIITGQFTSEVKATGSITLNLKKEGKKKCTVGPFVWYAEAAIK